MNPFWILSPLRYWIAKEQELPPWFGGKLVG